MSIMQLAESFGLTENGALKGTTNEAHRRLNPARAKALAEASELWGKAWGGDRMAALLVNEALTTSDLFVSATGDMLDRELLASYGEVQPVWMQYANRLMVRNFKPKKWVDLFGGRTRLERVPERTEYKGPKHGTAEYEIAVAKFGRRVGWSWEASVNDDIDELRQVPGNYAASARLTEGYAALETFTEPLTGAPAAAFFKNYATATAKALGYKAFNNKGTAALTSDALQDAITDISTRRDLDGNLVPAGPLKLVVGPALQFTAQRILSAAEVRTTNGERTTVEANYLKGRVALVVDPLLAGTSWYILPDPASAPRPAVGVAFLAGFETPDLRVSANTGSRPGGGAISPEEGDFDTDSVYWRVRHVTGAAAFDPIHTFGSDGSAGSPGV